MDALFEFLKALISSRIPQLISRYGAVAMVWLSGVLHTSAPTSEVVTGVTGWVGSLAVGGLLLALDLISHSLQKKKAE